MVPRRVVAVGGGTRSDLWPQIVSDVIGLDQDVPRHAVGAPYGDAMLAGLAAGVVGDEVHAWNESVRRMEPTHAHAETYTEVYGVYRRLYENARDELHTLAFLQGDTPTRAW
ncbi:MAG TPA: FGGY-family carbohydrate kinase [Egibacteraceae bacterium]|jgi:xylulokinase|nr:FGGY-family carbohydrate kinase [Egibacteraceae bacterium]